MYNVVAKLSIANEKIIVHAISELVLRLGAPVHTRTVQTLHVCVLTVPVVSPALSTCPYSLGVQRS